MIQLLPCMGVAPAAAVGLQGALRDRAVGGCQQLQPPPPAPGALGTSSERVRARMGSRRLVGSPQQTTLLGLGA